MAEILASHRGERGAVIAILQEAQQGFGYPIEEAISLAAKFFGVSASDVFGVASFCPQFRLTIQGIAGKGATWVMLR